MANTEYPFGVTGEEYCRSYELYVYCGVVQYIPHWSAVLPVTDLSGLLRLAHDGRD